jgi:two-component sensor histidine kinase
MGAEILELHADHPRAVRAARDELREHLDAWGCENVPDVILVFSELVTNAVVHATGAARIVIEYRDGFVRVEVHDNADQRPQVREAGDADGGFGLRIVRDLSASWGWEPSPTGKRVWSLIACGP